MVVEALQVLCSLTLLATVRARAKAAERERATASRSRSESIRLLQRLDNFLVILLSIRRNSGAEPEVRLLRHWLQWLTRVHVQHERVVNRSSIMMMLMVLMVKDVTNVHVIAHSADWSMHRSKRLEFVQRLLRRAGSTVALVKVRRQLVLEVLCIVLAAVIVPLAVSPVALLPVRL